jgi:hypothetical protein
MALIHGVADAGQYFNRWFPARLDKVKLLDIFIRQRFKLGDLHPPGHRLFDCHLVDVVVLHQQDMNDIEREHHDCLP